MKVATLNSVSQEHVNFCLAARFVGSSPTGSYQSVAAPIIGMRKAPETNSARPTNYLLIKYRENYGTP
jgi:hypothetical protein